MATPCTLRADEPPSGPDTSPARTNEAEMTKSFQVVEEGSFSRRALQVAVNLLKSPLSTVGQDFQNAPLSLGQVVTDSRRCGIRARKKAYHDRAGLLLELRLRLSGRKAPVHDLLRASPPLFDETATIKDPGDQRIAKARGVIPLEFGHRHARWQEAQTGDFQSVIVCGHEDGPAGDRVVAVADRVDEGFPPYPVSGKRQRAPKQPFWVSGVTPWYQMPRGDHHRLTARNAGSASTITPKSAFSTRGHRRSAFWA